MVEAKPALENLDVACADRAHSILRDCVGRPKGEAHAAAGRSGHSASGQGRKPDNGTAAAATKTENDYKDLEKLVTDALAVLEEQGVYALFLYLHSQKKKADKKVFGGLIKLLETSPQHHPLLDRSTNDAFLRLQSMARDLDRLLLAHDLLRRTLVYLRYHARVPLEDGGSP